MKRKAINKTPIIEIITARMEERGMTQAELAQLARKTAPVINDIISGRRSIGPELLVSISLVLGLDAIELGRMQSDYQIMQVINPFLDKQEDGKDNQV